MVRTEINIMNYNEHLQETLHEGFFHSEKFCKVRLVLKILSGQLISWHILMLFSLLEIY